MCLLLCWICITVMSIQTSGVASDISTVCRYARLILTMDCNNVNLKTISNNMYPINSPTLLILILQNTGLTSLDPYVFSRLTKLNRLDLSHNYLKTLDYSIFANLTNLWNLDLRHNRLIYLTDKRLFASQLKLKYLKLADNSLISMAEGVLQPLISLKYLYLSGNPFVCDCQLRAAMLWCENRNISTHAVCSYPDLYNGSTWEVLTDSDICVGTADSFVTTVILGVCVIVLVVCVMLAAWWICLKRGRAGRNRPEGDRSRDINL